MSINAKVSINRAIIDAVDVSDELFLREKPTLVKWALEADNKIGSFYDYKKCNTVLEVKNCRAQIPIGIVHIMAVVRGDIGCDCDAFNDFARFTNQTVIDFTLAGGTKTVFNWIGGNQFTNSDVEWEIQNNNLVFPIDLDGQNVTIMALRYEYDDDNFPLVNENNIEAISKYIQLKLAERAQWTALRNSKSLNSARAMIDFFKKEFVFHVRNARATTGKPSEADREIISQIWNNPITGGKTYLLNYRTISGGSYWNG